MSKIITNIIYYFVSFVNPFLPLAPQFFIFEKNIPVALDKNENI